MCKTHGATLNIPTILRSFANDIAKRNKSLINKLSLNEAISMASFYFDTVTPIQAHFALQLQNEIVVSLGNTSQDGLSQQRPLSRTETLRFVRAVYRFQILCHLINLLSGDDRQGRYRPILALSAIIKPWEVEELFLLYQFVHKTCKAVLEDIKWDIYPNKPKFDAQGRPPTPDGAFDLIERWHMVNNVDNLALSGLSVLRTILFSIDTNRETLITTVQQYLFRSFISLDSFPDGPLGGPAQTTRHMGTPSERDRLQAAQTPVPSGRESVEAAPLAWTTIWSGTYSSVYRFFVPDQMRRWGYVFWDAERLEESGICGLFKEEWERNGRVIRGNICPGSRRDLGVQ
ncbi:hypothetical protein N0V90_003953 [Kalmusia sp. IMI 367209]|nr:hypothetical protein N0V90_003953 [Kalmusia sp. IMI 367209]